MSGEGAANVVAAARYEWHPRGERATSAVIGVSGEGATSAVIGVSGEGAANVVIEMSAVASVAADDFVASCPHGAASVSAVRADARVRKGRV